MIPVTLHIGAPKTGSTFLQRWMEDNGGVLAAQGLHTIPLLSSHRLALECIRITGRRNREDAIPILRVALDRAVQQLTEVERTQPPQRCLLSSEYFAETDPAAVADFLGHLGMTVDSVICFVRRQDRVIASGINQEIKIGRRSRPDRSLRYRKTFDWYRLYTRWREALPEAALIFRNYDVHARHDTLLDSFKTDIGFRSNGTPDRRPRAERSNPSLNAPLMEACRLANERGCTHAGSLLLQIQREGFDGPRFGLSQDATTCIEAQYSASNAALAACIDRDDIRELAEPGWRSEGVDLQGALPQETLVALFCETLDRLAVAGSGPGRARQPTPAAPTDASLPTGGDARSLQPTPLLRRLSDTTLAVLLKPVFDARFYLNAYPDVRAAGMSPWLHYWRHGKAEGRSGKPGQLAVIGSPSNLDAEKDTVLVVIHEGSRTGAPIIGYNLVLGLRKTRNVVTLSLAPGPVGAACAAAGAFGATVSGRVATQAEAEACIRQLTRLCPVTVAIINGFGSRFVLPALRKRHIPAVTLIHEFASNIHPLADLRKTIEGSVETVFPSVITRDSALDLIPALGGRPFPVIPQGHCTAPPPEAGRHPESAMEIRAALGISHLPADTVVLMGAGSVDYRKGVDLFLQCAARFRARFPEIPAHFVWVGGTFAPSGNGGYQAYLADQIRREDLGDRVHLAGEILNMEAAYQCADLLLLTSRLDPLPNVCIEAMSAGLPLICFERTTGFADILNDNGLGPDCVAGYLNVEDMTGKAGALAAARTRRQALGATCRSIANDVFAMPAYVQRIEALVRAAADKRKATRP